MESIIKRENYNEITVNDVGKKRLSEIEQYKDELTINSDAHGMIIIPQRLDKNGGRLFAEESIDFLKFCKKNGVEVSISKRDGVDGLLALHSSEIWLPILYGALVNIPLSFVVGLLINYVSSKIGKNDKKKQTVNLEMVIKDGNKTCSVKYQGDADTFERKFADFDLSKWGKK